MSKSHKLNKICPTCGLKLFDNNKSGFCNKHRNRSGANNPFFGKQHPKWKMQQIALKGSIALKQKWKDIEYRQKVIKNSSKPRSQQGKKNISKGVKASYDNNDQLRNLRSDQMTKDWKEGNIVKGNHVHSSISKVQKEFYQKIKQLFPDALLNETIKLQDGKWLFADVLLPKQHIILQFNGNYWHANPRMHKQDAIIKGRTAKEIWRKDEQRCKKLQGSLNYRVIYVWEDQWKQDSKSILHNLDMLLNWESCSL